VAALLICRGLARRPYLFRSRSAAPPSARPSSASIGKESVGTTTPAIGVAVRVGVEATVVGVFVGVAVATPAGVFVGVGVAPAPTHSPV
jgi:hypothetical protein